MCAVAAIGVVVLSREDAEVEGPEAVEVKAEPGVPPVQGSVPASQPGTLTHTTASSAPAAAASGAQQPATRGQQVQLSPVAHLPPPDAFQQADSLDRAGAMLSALQSVLDTCGVADSVCGQFEVAFLCNSSDPARRGLYTSIWRAWAQGRRDDVARLASCVP